MNNGDLISREALKKRLEDLHFQNYGNVIMAVMEAPAVDAVEVGNCDGCIWAGRKRPQKCSCCRRNPNMKDCWEDGE